MKIIFAASLLSISLCSCGAYNDRSVHRNLVGPTVVATATPCLSRMSETKRTASSLPNSTASDLGKAHGSIGWKAYEHFSIANPLRKARPPHADAVV